MCLIMQVTYYHSVFLTSKHSIELTIYLIHTEIFCLLFGSSLFITAEKFSTPNCHVRVLIGSSFWGSRTHWFSPTQNWAVDGRQVVMPSILVEAAASHFGVIGSLFTSKPRLNICNAWKKGPTHFRQVKSTKLSMQTLSFTYTF